jgi:hypothetical protein
MIAKSLGAGGRGTGRRSGPAIRPCYAEGGYSGSAAQKASVPLSKVMVMFKVLFESKARVMLVQYRGILSSDHIASVDGFVKRFVSSEGYIRSIYDLTSIEAFAVPRTKLSERGRKLRMNPGQDRAFVTPKDELYALYCDYAREQLELGHGEMKVVRQLREALKFMDLRKPDFQPLVEARRVT